MDGKIKKDREKIKRLNINNSEGKISVAATENI